MLGKDKLNTIELLISKAQIDSYISHDEFISVNKRKRRNKNSWNFCGIYYIKIVEMSCVSSKKYTANENSSVRKTKSRLMLLSNCAIYGKK